MNKRHSFPAVLGGLFLLLSAAVLLAGDKHSAKDVTVSTGETQKEIFCLGGNVVIDGKVEKDVVAIGGTITINGTVNGDIVGIGSAIRVNPTAVICGDLAALGGKLNKEPGCTIKGETVYIQTAEINDRLFRHGPLRGFFALKFTPFFLFFKIVEILIWALLAVLAAALFAGRIESSSTAVRDSFWPVFGTGFLAIIVFIGLILVSTVLCLVLIGIPLLIAAAAAGVIIKAFGELVVFHVVGRSLLNALGDKNATVLGTMLAGLAVISLIEFVPIAGMLFSLGVSIVAWGAALRTRFGTRSNWFHRTVPAAVQSPGI